MVTLSVCATPASTNGVASAVAQVAQTLLALEHGATAAAKFCSADTGHIAGGGLGDGGGDGGLGDGGGGLGGGGDAPGHVASAVSEAMLTPAMAIAVD